MSLLETDVGELAAVPRVPAQRRAAEPSRIVDQEEDELERVREADIVQLSGRGERVRWVPAVERAAVAGISGILGSHEHMFPYDYLAS